MPATYLKSYALSVGHYTLTSAFNPLVMKLFAAVLLIESQFRRRLIPLVFEVEIPGELAYSRSAVAAR